MHRIRSLFLCSYCTVPTRTTYSLLQRHSIMYSTRLLYEYERVCILYEYMCIARALYECAHRTSVASTALFHRFRRSQLCLCVFHLMFMCQFLSQRAELCLSTCVHLHFFTLVLRLVFPRAAKSTSSTTCTSTFTSISTSASLYFSGSTASRVAWQSPATFFALCSQFSAQAFASALFQQQQQQPQLPLPPGARSQPERILTLVHVQSF